MSGYKPNRKMLADAVEFLKEEPVPEGKDMVAGVKMIPIEKVREFKDHPFRLYEGKRLEDMVLSVKEHGILTPVIVRKIYGGYEMLAGHNRMNAAKIAGLMEIPAIVKANLSDEDAYVYVIETNLVQRSFTDLLPTEKAAVLKERHDKIKHQGKHEDIMKEIEVLTGGTSQSTSGQIDQKLNSRKSVGKEYGLSETSVARLLRLNYLISKLKEEVDNGTLTFTAAMNLSYLSEEEQQIVYQVTTDVGKKITLKQSKEIRKMEGKINMEKIEKILRQTAKGKDTKEIQIKISAEIYDRYFSNTDASEIPGIVEKALEAYFGKGV